MVKRIHPHDVTTSPRCEFCEERAGKTGLCWIHAAAVRHLATIHGRKKAVADLLLRIAVQIEERDSDCERCSEAE
jgi:hypothetical protein